MFRQTWYIPRWVKKKQRHFHFYTYQSAAVHCPGGSVLFGRDKLLHPRLQKALVRDFNLSQWTKKKSRGIPLESSRMLLILWDPPPSLLLESACSVNSTVKICMVGQYSSLASNFPCSWLANTGWYGPSSKQLSLLLDYFSFEVPDWGGLLLLVCWLC